MDKGKIVVIHFPRSIFDKLIASVLYATTVYFIYLFFSNGEVTFSEEYLKKTAKFFAGLFFVIGFAIRYSATEDHHFDFKNMKYRSYFSFGPLGFGNWKNLKKLDRVSTFLNSSEEYEVNIWDIKNKKYKIALFYDEKNTVLYGRDLAKTLGIKFKERK